MPQRHLFPGLTALIGVLAGVLLSLGSGSSPAIAGELPLPVGKTVTVAADGSGDFKTVQEALNAATGDKDSRYVVHIKPGSYKEKLVIPGDKGAITFQGDDAEKTVLTFDDYAKTMRDGKEVGTSGSATILIQANDFEARNITFENSAGPVGQAVAVNVWSDRAVFRKCRFLGWQDTLLTNRNRQYFEDCFISGHVDYIFGASAAWFERCELNCRLGGSITAASTALEQPYGMVFSHCRITAAPLAERQAQHRLDTILGRTWRPYASVILLNTEISDVVRPEGWDNWGNPENEKTARYAEYNSTGPGGSPDKRVGWAKQLSETEAAAITPEKVLKGWNPIINGA